MASAITGAVFVACREAISEQTSALGADMVTVLAGTYTLISRLQTKMQTSRGDLDILGDLSIIGAGRDATIIDGNHRTAPCIPARAWL